MTREWKPGDVAVVFAKHGPHDSGEGREYFMSRSGHGWSPLEDSDYFWPDANARPIRPVVLLDPEDREQVQRLADEWCSRHGAPEGGNRLNAMQAALREFANLQPPKPEEPQGLGAVVEDVDLDETWVHFGNGCWILAVPNANLRQRTWRDFSDSVRVLSEGVKEGDR